MRFQREITCLGFIVSKSQHNHPVANMGSLSLNVTRQKTESKLLPPWVVRFMLSEPVSVGRDD